MANWQKNLVVALVVALVVPLAFSASVLAQQLPPPPPLPQKPGQSLPQANTSQLQQVPQAALAAPVPQLDSRTAAEVQQQAQGQFPIMERSTTMPLGALQRAWDSPYSASGQSAPGVMRYVWRPDFVMAVRTREYMATTVYFPEWERVGDVVIGDQVAFEVQRVRPNVIALRPTYPGADTNVTALGLSGNLYSFYVRSEGFNSDQISDFAVYVYANQPAGAKNQGDNRASRPQSSSGGASIGGGGAGSGSGSTAVPGGGPGGASAGGSATGGGSESWLDKHGLNSEMAMSAGMIPPDYIREIAFRPENLQFNMKIFAPTPEDAEIAPLRVFNDGIWTYFDFGDKADLVRRPVVYRVVDGVDSVVNTRTAGAKGNVLIAEAIGDFTMKNGDRTLCIYRDVPRPERITRGYNYDAKQVQTPGTPGLPSQLEVDPPKTRSVTKPTWLERQFQ